MATSCPIVRGGPRPAPRLRSEFADFTPPAAEPLARLTEEVSIDGHLFSPLATDVLAPVLLSVRYDTDVDMRTAQARVCLIAIASSGLAGCGAGRTSLEIHKLIAGGGGGESFGSGGLRAAGGAGGSLASAGVAAGGASMGGGGSGGKVGNDGGTSTVELCGGIPRPTSIDVDCPYGTPTWYCYSGDMSEWWIWTCPIAPPDAAGTQDALSCQPLAYSGGRTQVAGPSYCPVDPSLPECKSDDVGATVYRDEACALATSLAHPDCAGWQRDMDTEVVILRESFSGGCNVWRMSVDSVLDCGDHVSVAYTAYRPCWSAGACGDGTPSARAILIRNDAKPVWATGTSWWELCE
jgi:hypothetical protein